MSDEQRDISNNRKEIHLQCTSKVEQSDRKRKKGEGRKKESKKERKRQKERAILKKERLKETL